MAPLPRWIDLHGGTEYAKLQSKEVLPDTLLLQTQYIVAVFVTTGRPGYTTVLVTNAEFYVTETPDVVRDLIARARER